VSSALELRVEFFERLTRYRHRTHPRNAAL
jgi:hypothetical protein